MGATGLILVFPRARGFVRSVWGVETGFTVLWV